MTEQELNNKIKGAYSRATPNVLDSVRSQCEAQKGTVIPMTSPKKKKNFARRFGAIAAALALVIALGAGVGTWQAGHAVASTVSLDVNPSIEIKVNKNEQVLNVVPLNEDAKIVIGDMDFARSDLDVTINALIGSMLRNGYINELANSILISVDDSNAERGKALEARLAGEIDTLLQTGSFQGSVLSQTISADSELQTLASRYSITPGKAQLIQQIVAQDTRYTFEDLAPLSINELNLISETGSLQLDNVAATGEASDKAYIGAEAAMQAAREHFLSQLPTVSVEPHWEWELDFEHGRMVYEIEFSYVSGAEFECLVDALTGEVLSAHSEPHYSENHHDDHHGSSAAQPTPSADPTPSPSASTYISADEAKAAALAHAGVNAADAYGWECEFDRDDGRTVYEVDFHANGYEYSYEINATNGSVVKHEREHDDDHHTPTPSSQPVVNPTPSPSASTYISADEAKAAALAHAGVNAADAYDWECEFDRDDGRTVYDVDFHANGYEYSYEINATNGSVVKHEREHDDDHHTPSPSSQPVVNPTPSPSPSASTYISADEAKAAALAHAGVNAADAYGWECEFDRDDGRTVYEIEFRSGRYEYSYEIDAASSAVLDSEKELDD